MWFHNSTTWITKVMQICYVMEDDHVHRKQKVTKKPRWRKLVFFAHQIQQNLKDSFGNLLTYVRLPKECTTFVQGVEHLLHHDLENLLKSPQDAQKMVDNPKSMHSKNGKEVKGQILNHTISLHSIPPMRNV